MSTLATNSTTVSIDTKLKLTRLRDIMVELNLDAYLIPAIDEHFNLSTPPAKRRRAWISGFTGSAGELLVTQTNAYLFVDSRYYEQAELQTDRNLIEVCKMGRKDDITVAKILEKLAQAVDGSYRLGFDPFTLSIEQFNKFLENLTKFGLELVPVTGNLIDVIRAKSENIPPIPLTDLINLPVSVTGASISEKLANLRAEMTKNQITILPLTNLNQIAWLFNLRGLDIPNTPVFIAYAIVTLKHAFLFTETHRISREIATEISNDVVILPYEQYADTLTELVTSNLPNRVLLDPKQTTTGTYQIVLTGQTIVPEDDLKIVLETNPLDPLKARKNPVEIAQMELANIRSSRAKTRTLKWLDEMWQKGEEISEFNVKETIEQHYQSEPSFYCLGFGTIAGAGSNSSIVHYSTPNPDVKLKPSEFLLLDSGAQYIAGTTDDTRTLVMGEPTQLQIDRYTAVLAAHINCAMQKFPQGTTGVQIDAIARATLWQDGLEYGHGTGHGVGAFLSVHEGPNGISKSVNYPLEAGMISSIEPGYYEPGWGGIRIENLYVIKELEIKDDTQWLGFVPLTFIPFEKRLINLEALSKKQRQWLENYHQKVVENLTPMLEENELKWLSTACSF